jgi:hypothetical protein
LYNANLSYSYDYFFLSKARFTELTKKTAAGTTPSKSRARVRIPNKEQEYEYDSEDLENLIDEEDYYDSDYGMYIYTIFEKLVG